MKWCTKSRYWRHANQDHNEGSPPGDKNDHHQNVCKQYMLDWGWRRGTSLCCQWYVNGNSHYIE